MGGAGGIGQPLSMLMAMDPNVGRLRGGKRCSILKGITGGERIRGTKETL